MSLPLLKRTSSISLRIDQERGELQSSTLEKVEKDARVDDVSPVLSSDARTGADFEQEDDTDVGSSSEYEVIKDRDIDAQESNEAKPQRHSSRIMSMQRRGMLQLDRFNSIKFKYFANDFLAVRGEGKDFYLCRVLEDVPESKESFNIAWFDRVDDEKQHYKISYDDICYQASVIDRVKVTEIDGKFQLSNKHFKQVKKLLKEALQNDDADDMSLDESDDEPVTEDNEEEEEKEESEEESEEEAPPKKKQKRSEIANKERKKAGKKQAREKKASPLKRRGLMPNPNIKLVDKDPLFEEKNDLPIAGVKRGIRAVILNDMQMLKGAIEDVENVYTVSWNRSADIHLGPTHYALLNENKEALDLLSEKNQPERRAKPPNIAISRMNTGRYNFYTFGHCVRNVEASRGAREGNNAFLKESEHHTPATIKFCLKRNLSPEIISYYLPSNPHIVEELFVAIKNGHRKLAAYYVMKEAEKNDLGSYGFNFLHKEVLVNDNEPLSKFRSISVTKKTYLWRILPLHCAAINPNPKYLQELYAHVPDYQIQDAYGRKLIHYAAACEGPGPLNFLLARGADPNDVDKKGTTPLMIAAKLGRHENVDELMKAVVDIDIGEADDEGDDDGIEQRGQTRRVNINAKHRRTTKAAIHYASKNGHECTVRLLIKHGAKIDLQAGASKGNMTALAYAAEQGHLDIVKALVELGAAPDGKVRFRKTPLMLAAQNGHYKIMAYLLHIGVNPNAEDSSQNTPIHYAAAYGWYHCVKLLLEAGADPNAANNWKTTPLSIALLKDNIHCADLLLRAEVNVDFPDDKGATVLMNQLLALSESTLEKVQFLVEKKGANVNHRDMSGSNSLHYLASNSVFKEHQNWRSKRNRNNVRFDKASSDVCNTIATFLIEAGADINVVNEDGYTPLMTALLQNNFPLVEIFIKNNSSTSLPSDNKSGNQPIQYLLSKTETLDLIELFDDVSVEEANGMSQDKIQQIYSAHKTRNEERMFHLFLEHGTDLNLTAKNGTTTLMISIQQGSESKTKQILEKGADPRVGKNQFGQNTMHVLASHCTQINSSSVLSMFNEKFDLTSDFVNQVDNDGYTPILLACEALASKRHDKAAVKNGQSFIKFLIEKCKADVYCFVTEKKIFTEDEKEDQEHRNLPNLGLVIEKNKRTEDDPFGITGKFTCLHFLAMVPSVPDDQDGLIKFVSKHASDDLLNSRCRHGRTPLHQAIKSRNSCAVSQLIKAGCDVSLPSLNDEEDLLLSPLSLASRPASQIDIVKEILAAKADSDTHDGKEGRTPLSYAVTNVSGSTVDGVNVIDLIKAIADAGAQVNSCDNNKRIPFHHLINSSSGGYDTLTEVEEFVLSFGAAVCVTDCDQRMPLFYAFLNFDSKEEQTTVLDPISVVKLVCDHAVKRNEHNKMLSHKDKRQRTILHYAALRGASISCLHLLKHGATVTELDEDGNTPVSLALRSGHNGCAMILLQHNSKLTSWKVNTPVTSDQIKKYEDELGKKKWRYAGNCSVEKPKQVTKSAFQLSIENDWPGIAYMILEYGGISLFDAFRASLKAGKLNLVWTLLKQQRNPNSFHAVDHENFNLLHMLATHANLDESENGMVMQIAKFLIEKGVNPASSDTKGVLPLHLAARNTHFHLCKLFLECSLETLNKATKDGYTPVAAVFGAYGGIQEKHVKLIKYFVSRGVATFDVCYYTGTLNNDGEPESTTILNDLVLLDNEGSFAVDGEKNKQGSIEYLLANGADINFANKCGENPLMTAILMNSVDMVKLLLSYNEIDLDAVTKKGESLMHLCLASEKGFYKENTEIFNLLKMAGANMEHVDNAGYTPLHYALKQPTGGMVKLFPYRLRKNLKPEVVRHEEVFPFKSKVDECWQGGKQHVSEDAYAELMRLSDIPMESEDVPIVDKNLNLGKHCVVYADQETGVYYDAVLTKVDISRGRFGINVFYKLQVVHHKGKKLWLLFNRWNRIGAGEGQHQETPFTNPEEACSEFRKIFKSKTGNRWEDVNSFQKMPNKYSLVKKEKNPEKMLHRKNKILKPFDVEKGPKSNLPKDLQILMKILVELDYPKFIDGLDTSFMPFGLISRDVIEDARVIVKNIRELLEEESTTSQETEMYEQIADMSNSLYMMIPPTNYAYERISPLNSIQQVKDFAKKLDLLTELSVASELLLAAQHKKQDINPLDYVYRGIDAHCELMDSSSKECQYILQYLENSCKDDGRRITGGFLGSNFDDSDQSIAGIYRIRRKEEDTNFDDCGINHDRQLLWHGTNSAHVIGILKQGLQSEVRDANISGRSLGNGIYFTLSFKKALRYSSFNKYTRCCGFVFLCEVALGEEKVIKFNGIEDTEEDLSMYNSCSIIGHEMPDPEQDIFMPNGTKIRLGNWIPNKDPTIQTYGEHECVVRDPRQIKIRYLVMVN